MLIRAKYHWVLLMSAAFYFLLALVIVTARRDHFAVPFYFGIAFFSLLAWSTTYTTLRSGILKKRILLITYRSFPVGEIESIRPHKKNGKWSYGTVVDIYSATGKKLTLQPNHPSAFLEMLRQQARQAEYLM